MPMNKINYTDITLQLACDAWELYTNSFPIEEQRPLSLHQKAINDTRFHPYVYVSDQDELLAICFYWQFPQFKYLEHFAVNPKYRNKGIGSKIIKNFAQDHQPVILEIEPPIDTISIQRLRFYKRNLFKETPHCFKQLKYQKIKEDVWLNLLCNQEMSTNLFQQFQDIIYQELTIYCEGY